MAHTADITEFSFTSRIDAETQLPWLDLIIGFSDHFSEARAISLLCWVEGKEQTWIYPTRDSADEPFRHSVELHPNAPDGVYAIRSIQIQDDSGVQLEFDSDQLRQEFSLTPSTSLTNPNADNISPSLLEAKVQSAIFDEEGIRIPVIFKADDNLSGLQSDFIIELLSPSGSSIQRRHSFDQNGAFEGVFDLPKFSASGEYSFNSIRITDQAGNETHSEEWVETSSVIEIDNPNGDITPPELNDFELDAEFDPATGRPRIVFSGNANDNLSGISGIYLRLNGPEGTSQALDTWIYEDHYSGNQRSEVDFLHYKALTSGYLPGTYLVDYLRFTDAAENEINYSGDDLNAMDMASAINVLFQNEVSEDLIAGADDRDHLFGSHDADDTLYGGGSDDKLLGGGGDDLLDAGSGNDTLDGGEGRDRFITTSRRLSGFLSQLERDHVLVNLTEGTAISAGLGTNTLVAIEDILSGAGDDRLTGSHEDNRIDAGEGDDTLHGAGGNDTLRGEHGSDLLVGGEGRDTALFSGDLADYAITPTANGFLFRDQQAVRDGSDTLMEMEVFSFADQTLLPEQLSPLGEDFDGDLSVNAFSDGLLVSTAALLVERAAGTRNTEADRPIASMGNLINPKGRRTNSDSVKTQLVDAINNGILETNANGMLDLQDAHVLLRRLLGTFPSEADTKDLISSPGGNNPIPLISGADQQSVIDSWS